MEKGEEVASQEQKLKALLEAQRVAEDLILTNHHCVPGILDNPQVDASTIAGVRFVAGYLRDGIEEDGA